MRPRKTSVKVKMVSVNRRVRKRFLPRCKQQLRIMLRWGESQRDAHTGGKNVEGLVVEEAEEVGATWDGRRL